jgi:hypothetical protein
VWIKKNKWQRLAPLSQASMLNGVESLNYGEDLFKKYKNA